MFIHECVKADFNSCSSRKLMNLSFIISCFLFLDWEVDASITSLDMIPFRDRLHFAYITNFLLFPLISGGGAP